MDKERLARMKDLLKENHSWPCEYIFKFIVPIDKVSEVLTLVGERAKTQTRPSKKGNYISVTAKIVCEKPDDVITIYKRLSIVEGIITL